MTQYELPDGFFGMETAIPRDLHRVLVIYNDGVIEAVSRAFVEGTTNPHRIGWAPIVPLKAKRWRAGYAGIYYSIGAYTCDIRTMYDYQNSDHNAIYNSGNYFKTIEEAKASPIYKAFQEMRTS